jgi:hypothetical protein
LLGVAAVLVLYAAAFLSLGLIVAALVAQSTAPGRQKPDQPLNETASGIETDAPWLR